MYKIVIKSNKKIKRDRFSGDDNIRQIIDNCKSKSNLNFWKAYIKSRKICVQIKVHNRIYIQCYDSRR